MSWVTDVRTDAVERLVAATTSAGSRVYDSRRQPIQASEPTRPSTQLPAIIVHTTQVKRQARGNRAGVVEETVTLVVECFARDSGTEADIAESIDTLEDEAFAALWDDQTWASQYVGAGLTINPSTLTRETESSRVGYAVFGFDLTRRRSRTVEVGGEPLNTIKQAVSLQPSNEVKANAALDELDGEPTP